MEDDVLAVRGQLNIQAQIPADPFREGARGIRVAVHHEDRLGAAVGGGRAAGAGEVPHPILELALIRVCREPRDRSDLAIDGEFLAVDPRLLRPVLNRVSQAALPLIADEQQHRGGVGEEVLEVVQDPSAGQHPRRGDDHERLGIRADRL